MGRDSGGSDSRGGDGMTEEPPGAAQVEALKLGLASELEELARLEAEAALLRAELALEEEAPPRGWFGRCRRSILQRRRY